MDDILIAEALSSVTPYFETLYYFNRNLIMLCGLDLLNNHGQYESKAQELIIAIPKLIPYSAAKGSPKRYTLSKRDGLMEFEEVFPGIAVKYEAILKKYNSFLGDIKDIRNKLEHKMHAAPLWGGESGSYCFFRLTYRVDEREVSLDATDFIGLAQDLNRMFSDIQHMVDCYIKQEVTDESIPLDQRLYNPKREPMPYYYRRLLRYPFVNFNALYECDQLRNFGKALFPF